MKNLPLVKRLSFEVYSDSHNFKLIFISMSDTENKSNPSTRKHLSPSTSLFSLHSYTMYALKIFRINMILSAQLKMIIASLWEMYLKLEPNRTQGAI